MTVHVDPVLGAYTLEDCRACGGTGKPDWPDAIGRCVACGGDGEVRVYLYDDQDDDQGGS